MNFWAGKEYSEAYYITLFLIIPVTVPLIQNLGIEIQRAKNMHRSRSLVYLLISIGNILISIPLIKIFGAIGAAIGTAIALIAGNVIFINWYYHKKIKLDMYYFWKNIISACPSVILSIFIGCTILKLWQIESIINMSIFICVYILVYVVSIYFFGLNKYEKNLIIGIKNKIRKERMK